MAGQSITFDFISRGAPALAGDFKRTGDNAAAAARGAKVLQDVIKTLGEKENRTAAESKTLASALRQTGDAEDRAAAKALAADIAIRRLDDALKDSSKSAAGAKGGLAGLAGEVTGFGAASGVASSKGTLLSRALAGINLASGVLEPALAGVVVAAGGAVAAFASAGIGLSVFGAVAGSVLSQASTAAKAYTTAQKQLNLATTSAQRQAALKAEKAALYGLDAAQKRVVFSVIGAQKAWQGFTKTATPGVAKVLAASVRLLPQAFGLLRPFLAPVESALAGIIGELKAGTGPGSQFSRIMGDFASHSGKDLTLILETAGHLFMGVLGAVHAFIPEGGHLLVWADQASAKFAKWGETLSSHTGFQSLMTTFKTETPQAMTILKNLGVVIGNVGKSMFGLSTFSNSKVLLQALLPLSGILASLSRNQGLSRVVLYLVAATLAAKKLGPAFTGIKAAVAFFPAAGAAIVAFAGAAEGATAAQVIAAAATRAWGLAMDALPWVALAAAVVAVALLVIKYHTQIWHFMQVAWHDILAVIMTAWNWVKNNWPLLLAIITGPIGIAALAVIKNWQAITGAARAAWNTIAAGFRWLVDQILGVFSGIIHGAAAAFGWIPGLGGKLRGAAKAFDGFRADVNAALGGINGRTVNVSVAMTSSTNPYPGGISGRAAAGMYVSRGVPGVDDQLILAQRGEVIVPTDMVSAGAVDHLRGRIPGFAAGGQVGVNVNGQVPSAKTVESTLMGSVNKLARAFAATFAGSGPAIVAYARQFLGQIPYVMGGNSLSGGIDCSGFTQQVLGHFGIHAPRTSETQFGWVRRTGPVPGGLAFYVSPGGGPPPGHVAIVQDGNSVISQGGGMGPKIMGLHAMPLMGTGIPPAGFGGAGGSGGNGPAMPAASGGLQAIAMALLKQYGWGNQWNAFNALEMAEAGWRLDARNPSSGAYGLAQFINGPSEYFSYGGNPNTGLGQLTAMDNYIASRYGSPNAAWGHEQAFHWYAGGTPAAAPGWAVVGERGPELVKLSGGEQIIPGFASGGQVAAKGAADLRAWRAHRQETVNLQIEHTAAAQHSAAVLASARLPRALHQHYVTLAARDKAHLNALYSERTVMRDWRGNLAGSDATLHAWIAAAGNTRSLQPSVRAWKRQLAGQEKTIGEISLMLGLTTAQLKAYRAALAAKAKAGKGKPPVATGVQAVHSYGGDVTDTIGAFLAAVASPFTGAPVTMDRGGWLRPGLNSVWNGTGRPEPVGAARGGGTVRLEISSGGSSAFDQFMLTMIRKYVKVKGGTGPGAADRAFAAH